MSKDNSKNLKWQCGCGQVQLEMTSEPYFYFDCHCSACTPVAKYLDAKSNGKGISAMVHNTGVAKAFFLLDQVQFVQGKDKVAGVKLGPDGQNVRAYTTCCHTLLIGDSPVPFPFRPFNRNALQNADGTPFQPSEGPAWGVKGGDNPWYDQIPEPKHPGDPDWVVAKCQTANEAGTVGDFADDATPGLFPEPDKTTEFVPKP